MTAELDSDYQSELSDFAQAQLENSENWKLLSKVSGSKI